MRIKLLVAALYISETETLVRETAESGSVLTARACSLMFKDLDAV